VSRGGRIGAGVSRGEDNNSTDTRHPSYTYEKFMNTPEWTFERSNASSPFTTLQEVPLTPTALPSSSSEPATQINRDNGYGGDSRGGAMEVEFEREGEDDIQRG